MRILIADDSVIYRTQIKEALGGIPGAEIVGTASNGKIALDRMSQTPVDLLILDLEMPEMDGLETLRQLSQRRLECKVLVFSSASKRGADISLEALRLGATDFIAKPGGESLTSASDDGPAVSKPSDRIRHLLEPRIHALFPQTSPSVTPSVPVRSYGKVIWDLFSPQVIVIGSSTGGPKVLEEIFTALPGPLGCPVVIAQHMPPVFTASLADRLTRLSRMPFVEATHDLSLEPQKVYIAPGDYHLSVGGQRSSPKLMLSQGPKVNFVRPAVDILFESAATLYQDRCLAIVLTGMGSDGRAGAQAIKDAGGATIIQREDTCVVFGMPGAVKTAGAYDLELSPQEIIHALTEKAINTPLKAG